MRIKLIFETETGTTQFVAEAVKLALEKEQHQVELHSVKYQGKTPDLANFQAVIVGGPTYNDGLLEQALNEFLTTFHPDLSQFKVAVFALGDRSYPQFCTAAQLLENWVKSNKGSLITESLKVDGFPSDTKEIDAWVKNVSSLLQ